MLTLVRWPYGCCIDLSRPLHPFVALLLLDILTYLTFNFPLFPIRYDTF